ncbi:MAG: efflux RND transporter permease subunit [Treponema sp.]|jgi:multidrug efflux pump subunit AcrB|nr:efflux RND transporter permease subunit [Treponema sp.]
MKGLISAFAGRPVAVIMMLCALLVAAVFFASGLPLEQLPGLALNRVTVKTSWPGMGAQEIRSLLTIPVEDALSPVKGLENMRSVSRDNFSLIILDFRWGIDGAAAAVLVREAVDAVWPSLPEGVNKPAVSSGTVENEPFCIIAVQSLHGDGNFARNLAEYELKARLRRLGGIGQVILLGGDEMEELVEADLRQLAARGISVSSLAELLSSETMNMPAGMAREGDRELVVVSSGQPGSAEELASLSLSGAGGPFRLSDAAGVSLRKAEKKSLFILNGEEAAALKIYRRPGSDPSRLSREIGKLLEEARENFGNDGEFFMVYDSSSLISGALKNLLVSAALGVFAVVLSLCFFIRHLRSSFLAALAIPVSTAAGLCAIALRGTSLNSMSLGGLALGIGMVSDSAVIVLEILHRRFGTGAAAPSAAETGEAASTVMLSGAASLLTTAVVFVPILFLPGPLGALFGDLSIALVVSIAAGWIYAQFCLPSLYRISFKTCREASPRGLEEFYGKFLRLADSNSLRMILLASLLTAAGIFILVSRPRHFVSPDEERELRLSVLFPPGYMLESMTEKGRKLTLLLGGLPGIRGVFAYAGAEDEDLIRLSESGYREEELIFHCFISPGTKSEEVRDEISRLLENYSEGEINVFFPQNNVEKLLGLSESTAAAVRGRNPEETMFRAKELAGFLGEKLGEGTEIILDPSHSRPEFRIYPDREASVQLGIQAADLAGLLHSITDGMTTGRLEPGGRPIPVRLRGKMEDDPLGVAASLQNIPVALGEGNSAFLGSLCRIERLESPETLSRLNRSDVVYVSVKNAPGNVFNEVFKSSDTWNLIRSDESVFTRYRQSLIITLVLVILLLYLVMGAQFESFFLPLVLMFSIPFSLAGAGPALFLSGASLDSGAVLGLAVLFGLSVNNAIILYEIGMEKLDGTMQAGEAFRSGALERFRAISITTITTVFALLPLVCFPLGASQRSMAAAMLGGITASALLCLFVMPHVLSVLVRRRI